MGTTSRFGLRYPALTDAPNGPQGFQFLAEDVEARLSRVLECTSTTRPTGVPSGFMIRETDTGSVLVYTGSTWAAVGSSGGGGGGGSDPAVEGQWKASAAQSLANGADTVLAFGTTETSSSVVLRATSGAGHKFTLLESGCFAITAMCRFAPGTAASRFLGLRNAAQTVEYHSDQGDGGPSAATRQFSIVKRFAALADLVVVAAQSSGAALSTVANGSTPSGVPYVRLTIVKLTD